MNAEAKEVESAVPAVESRAKEMGWATKEEYRGDPETWLDAEAFVKRGEDIMPILKANNRKLLGEVSNLKGELNKTQTLLKSASDSIEALKEFNSEIARKAAREEQKKLVTALAEARRSGDVDAEIQLTEQLEGHKEARAKAEEKPVVTPPPPDPAQDPAWKSWVAENPWFGQDQDKTDMAIVVGNRIRANPAFKGIEGRAFLDKVSEELDRKYGNARREAPSKVEGGRASGDSGSVKGWNSLPSEAKEACERLSTRVVGPGRAYTDMNAWRKAYAEKYFS